MSLSSISGGARRRNNQVTEDTYIRDVPPLLHRQLAVKLDIDNMWELLAEQIPRRPDSIFEFLPDDAGFEPRYTSAHLAIFRNKNNQRGDSATRSLLTEWGTLNSKVKHLILALKRARLLEAAQFVEKHLPPQNPGQQPVQIGAVSSSECLSRQPAHSVPNSSQGHICHESPRTIPAPNTVREDQVLSGEGVSASEAGTKSEQISYRRFPVPSEHDKAVSVGEAPPSEEVEEDSTAFEEFHIIPDVLQKIDYRILKKITNNFDRRHYKEGGRLIGEGGFGDVFLGTFHSDYTVAVKRMKLSTEDSIELFKTEVETLSNFRHENIVLLMGYSIEGDSRCLVYQYMPNGSLEERLACRFGTPPLSAAMRLEIMRGTARGIVFLDEGGLVHRDIKSANILLDTQFTPKVGDFATAKVSPSQMTKTFMLEASKVIGSAPYLAPEAYSFKITPKLDSYSFGVVLLEILTGLPVLDPDREEKDLKIHVQEHCYEDDEVESCGTIFDLLDHKAGDWDEAVVKELYSISCRCLLPAYQRRPKIGDFLSNLEALSPQFDEEQAAAKVREPTESGE
ncbi:interleukin-1 receptor-associated kinase 4 isoform X2 [Aplysia californica]|uniref:non-specific serine/threonine protein kinase n=1 Tax=Aplysia californica TaxID=6500 RepID=A0ABM1VY63_APLCA|nr:interleukin-1 receptor-associated kinase 4 isoform X2 [Aplysia californica]XP_035827356.1 interleukin-1 receptor-associated kinase 4 isoform X2 [Aplysia californica]